MNEIQTEKELALLWQRLAEFEQEILRLREQVHALYRQVGALTDLVMGGTEKGGKS